MEILQDFVMPINVVGSKIKTSKYLTAEQIAVIGKLRNGQAIILPFIGKGQAKITHHRMNMVNGVEPRTTPLVDFILADLPENKGCAVKRVTNTKEDDVQDAFKAAGIAAGTEAGLVKDELTAFVTEYVANANAELAAEANKGE